MQSKGDEMTSDIGEMFNAHHKAQQSKRAHNREDSAQVLRDADIDFLERNHGAHLIVTGGGHTFDFWPGTGLWQMRGSTQKHRGVHKLVDMFAARTIKDESK